MDEAKPFLIPKREVWEAFKRVKVNQGAAGVDGQSIEDFEATCRATSTSSGIECPQGATSPRRCGASTFRKQVVASGRWAFQRSPTACSGSRSPISGADLGAGVSSGLLWLSARQICD